MIYVHEKNFLNKIANNYGGVGEQINDYLNEIYYPFREKMNQITFDGSENDCFVKAANLYNEYENELSAFASKHDIKSQSKLESTLPEELSVYLFKDIPEIHEGKLNVFNKGIYAGLKIKNDLSLDIVTKDVDFCIGREVKLKIEQQNPISIIVPIVSVEVKTYLDATMFGEIKSSSKTLKSASPNSKAYVLMGYKDLADEHILAARQDSTLDEMFVLRAGKGEPVDPRALKMYWIEVSNAIKNVTSDNPLQVPGRLFAYNDLIGNMLSN